MIDCFWKEIPLGLVRLGALFLLCCLFLNGCVRPDPNAATPPGLVETAVLPPDYENAPAPPTPAPPTRPPTYTGTPTPDPPHPVAQAESEIVLHTVRAGETLGYIAQLYGRSLPALLELNEIGEDDFVFVGQQIRVPVEPALSGPRFKIIPDSELVYGAAAKGFDVRTVANSYSGYLLQYSEEVEGVPLAGPEIVSLVAHRYSVNPRLLLVVLEHRAGWVTQPVVVNELYPLTSENSALSGLYRQLGWAANQLNLGYYGRSEGNRLTLLLNDGSRIAYNAQINDGTAAVQRLLGQTNSSYGDWLQEVGPNGFFATYTQLFGNPFAYTVDPVLPVGLVQPPLRLPWADDETWYLTSGPHGGWAEGSAWAAIDFAPPGAQLGCVASGSWVTAVSDGVVTRSDFGAVVVDTDGDNFAGTGWAIIYMHIATNERIGVGEYVRAGDRIGHPSCEGGFSNGTHLHIARTFNGRWISADGAIPFDMDGWVSQGDGREYDGFMVKGTAVKEACQCREEINGIPGQ